MFHHCNHPIVRSFWKTWFSTVGLLSRDIYSLRMANCWKFSTKQWVIPIVITTKKESLRILDASCKKSAIILSNINRFVFYPKWKSLCVILLLSPLIWCRKLSKLHWRETNANSNFFRHSKFCKQDFRKEHGDWILYVHRNHVIIIVKLHRATRLWLITL